MKNTSSLLAFLNGEIIAQAKLETMVDEGINTILLIGLLLCVGGIIVAAFQLFKGNIEHALYIVLGSILMGGGGFIARSIFETFK